MGGPGQLQGGVGGRLRPGCSIARRDTNSQGSVPTGSFVLHVLSHKDLFAAEWLGNPGQVRVSSRVANQM